MPTFPTGFTSIDFTGKSTTTTATVVGACFVTVIDAQRVSLFLLFCEFLNIKQSY